VYVLRYRYQNQQYLFLLNGQTGRAWGSKPISWRKVLVAVIVTVLIAIFLVGVVALLSRNP
jgi:small-conductance mechanosensitive channel